MIQFLHSLRSKTVYTVRAILLLKIFLFASALNVQAQNNALYFDGNNSYIAANSVSNALSGTTEMSMEAWINRADNLTETKFVLTFHQPDNINNRENIILLGINKEGQLAMTYNEGTANIDNYGTTVIPANTWTHIALTIASDNTALAYINGEQELTWSIPTRPVTDGYFSIAQDFDNTSVTNDFIGKIDEVRIWDKELTEDEIRANMYKELAGTESNLVAYYDFNFTSGIIAPDKTGNNNGTLMGNPVLKASGAFAGPRNALDFDGTDDYVLIPDDATTDITGSVTVELWANYETLNSKSAMVVKGMYGDDYDKYNYQYFFYLSSDKKLVAFWEYGSGTNVEIFSSKPADINTNEWHHFVFVRNSISKTVTFYCDGKQLGDVMSYSANPENGLDGPIYIGSEYYAIGVTKIRNPFSGSLDEVRIWNTSRSATDIRENMMKPLAGTEAGLVAYYRFDEVGGTKLYDIAGNNNNGTLTNMTGDEWIVSGAFNTWLGVESTDWSNAANWSGGVPASTDNVGIYKTELGSEASIGGSVNNLMLSSTATPALNSGITVNGNLILENNVNLNGQTVTLGNSATLIEDAGAFYGTSGTISTTRSLSNINQENVAGLGATITTVENLGTTTITRGHKSYSMGSDNSVNRYFDISPANNSGLNATLSFTYREEELNGNTEANLEMFKSSDGGSSWQNQNGNVNTTSNSASLSGITSFSTWTLIEDTQSPTAEITYSPSGPYHTGDVVTLTATFSEEMKDTPISQISISGSNTLAATNLVKSNVTVYTYDYIIQAGLGNCNVFLSTGTDLAGNVVQSAPTSGATFTIVNQNPTFTSTPVTSVNDNEFYEYAIAAGDGDGDAVSISGVTVPLWLNMENLAQVSTLAGSGIAGSEDGTGIAASFFKPMGVAVDHSGTIYVADYGNKMIRRILPTGEVSTFATLSYAPSGMAVDNSGNVYASCFTGSSGIIYKITSAGEVSTFCNSGLSYALGMAFNDSGDIILADGHAHKIYRISSDGTVSTFAGTGVSGTLDGVADQAQFVSPAGIAIDIDGNVYVSDYGNYLIRKISIEGVVTTIAGSEGVSGFQDGLGTEAKFGYVWNLAVDEGGNIIAADRSNNRIRMITPEGQVSTIAGGNSGYVDGLATSAQFREPHGICIGPAGEFYIAEFGNHRIRKITQDLKLKGSTVGHVGEHPVLLKATDTNGGETLQNFTITVNDVTPPSGYSAVIDQSLINASNMEAVNFTLTGAETGTTCNYTFSSDNGGTPVSGSSPVTSTSQKVTGIDLSGLPDGTVTLSVKLKDVADNEGSTSSDTSTKDATPPSGYAVSFDQAYVNSINENLVSFTFSGAEIGSGYNYTITSSGGGTAVTGSGTIATATDQISGINLSGLGDGTLTLTAKLTDAAGNVGSQVTNIKVKDTVAPAVPFAPDLDSGSDTGSLSTDDITSDNTPTFSGTVEANAIVEVISSVSGTLGTTTADGSGNWSFTSGVLMATKHNIIITATDEAGNTSSASSALSITVDVATPAIIINDGIILNEGATATIAIDNLEANDADSENSELTFIITSSPSNGQLENKDNEGVAILSFTQQDLIDGKIQYIHDDSNTTSDSFTFKVADNVPNELTWQTFAISVSPVDDDTPTIVTNNGLKLDEGATVTIPLDSLEANDTDTDNATLTYTIITLPVNGQLENSDNPGVSIFSFTQQQLLDGKISYEHDNSNTTSDSFIFKVADGVPNELTGQQFNIAVNAIDDDPPAVTTVTPENVAITTATLGGNIANDFGLSIIEKGVVYSISSVNNHPEIGDAGVLKDANSNETSVFSETISSLLPNTTYSFQAYATNSVGTSYGGVVSFTTSIDNIAPDIQCNAQEIYLDEDGTYILSSTEMRAFAFGTTDNVDDFEDLIVSISKRGFNCSQIGEDLNAKVTVTDMAGNESYCLAEITVHNPAIYKMEPIDNIEVEVEEGECGATIAYPDFESNSCASFIQLSGMGPDAIFPIGTTTETWEITDMNGNTDTISFDVTVTVVNSVPTLDLISDVEADEDAEIEVLLTGISYGNDCEAQNVLITAESANTDLVETVKVNYIQGNSTGTLSIALSEEASGTASITVYADDNEGGIVSRAFDLVVTDVNDSPHVVYPLADQFVNASHVLKIPVSSTPGEFFDDSDNSNFTLRVMKEGTDTLPSWVVYERDTLFCTPSIADTGCVNIVVQATDPEGATAADTFSICAGGYPLNVGDIGAEVYDVQIYPNPTKGKVNLDINSSEVYDVELLVMDIVGNVVLKKQYPAAQTIRFNMSGKVSGMYFVHLNFDGIQVIKKLIVN